ncbi:Ectoine hydrolase [bacterium HR39]|nr:Ectoine hydrolase [bacterium HR39]
MEPLLHVPREEYGARLRRTLDAMAAAGLDGLLLFSPASHYWLTGYDTFGYCFFQCLVLRADGEMALLTRTPDLRQARLTSIIPEIRIWKDGADADPVRELRALLAEKGLLGRRLGVEWDTHGLTGATGRRLEGVLGGDCRLEDASLLVSRLRLVKSPTELAFVRRAAELADSAFGAALSEIRPGGDEARILARMQGAVFEGGGDYPANPFIIGSGPKALLCRYSTGRRRLDAVDRLTLEWAGVFRHYHAALMRTVCVGEADAYDRFLFDACREALSACEERLVPGATLGEVFAAHARTLDRYGLAPHRMAACGYSLGAVFAPSWMDWPMIHAGSPVVLEPGMVFFVHIIVMDSERGRAMTLGRTSVIGEDGPEPLSRLPVELAVAA